MLRTVVEKLKLRRMRFKVDPAIANLEDFDGDTSYEGYVLNENHGVVTILIVDPNNGVRQTQAYAQSLNVLSPDLNVFKKNMIKVLMNSVSEQVLMQIQNAATFDEVEQLARQNGATDEQVKSAQQPMSSESTIAEQGPLGKAVKGAAEKVKGIATGSGLVRRTLGKAADIGKEVAFGKDAKTLGQKAAGAFNILGRVGETLKKTKTGGFKFSQRSSMFHKDKPRMGQRFEISYDKQKRNYQITGTVAGEKTSGDEKFIQLKNISINPPFEDYEKSSGILVKFSLNSPSANFFVYDDANKLRDQFSAKVQYDTSSKTWEGTEPGRVVEIKDDETAESVAQGKKGSFEYNGKYYVPISDEPITADGKQYIVARLADQPTQNPQLIDVKNIRS